MSKDISRGWPPLPEPLPPPPAPPGPRYPRIIVEGPTQQDRVFWRVVLDKREDSNGIAKEVRIIELYSGDVDALGVKQWRRVNFSQKTGMSDWVLVAEAALDLALQQQGD
jgi:hypothetical protein